MHVPMDLAQSVCVRLVQEATGLLLACSGNRTARAGSSSQGYRGVLV